MKTPRYSYLNGQKSSRTKTKIMKKLKKKKENKIIIKLNTSQFLYEKLTQFHHHDHYQ